MEAGSRPLLVSRQTHRAPFRPAHLPSFKAVEASPRSEEVGFAHDSALEGDGFEPSVPGVKELVFGGESELRVIETGASHKKLFSLGEKGDHAPLEGAESGED
jgi:hypothetical protein